MMRFVWLGLRLLVVMIVAVWLSNHPGRVSIRWQHHLMETSVGALVVIIASVLGALFLLNRLFRDLMRIPERWARHREARTGRRGRQALTSGLAAVASGDAIAAQRLARQTEAAIVDPVLSHLLAAEALILSGDIDAAERQFELLLGRDDTRVIGHRGLIEVALARGDWARAYSRARQARAAMPRSPWLVTLLVDLAARAGDFGEARASLDFAIRNRLIAGSEARRRQLTLWTALGDAAAREGRAKEALALAEKALGEQPGFIPAATLGARLSFADDRQKTAARILEAAWAATPHPDLVDAWATIAPANDAQAVAGWMAKLQAQNPRNIDAALAAAEARIAAGSWAEARDALEALIAQAPEPRAYHLMGRLEQREAGRLAAAVEWFGRAGPVVAAPRWTCGNCGHHAQLWSAVCPSCGGFAYMQPVGGTAEPAAAPATHASLPGIGTPLAIQSG